MSEKLALPIEAVDSPEEALEDADIVATVTSARHPVFPGALSRPGTHINAAGSNHVLRRELDADTIRRAAVIAADSIEQARMEAGDLTQAADEGVLDWSSVCELHEVLSGAHSGRTSEDQTTLFESEGLAVEDVAMADYLYRAYR